MIDELRSLYKYKLDVMCHELDLSRSGYYAWKRRMPSARKLEDERITVVIKAAHERSRGTYDPDKIQDELAD